MYFCTYLDAVLNRIYKRNVKNLFSKFFQNGRRLFKEALILKIDQTFKLNVYIILKQGKCHTLGPSLCLSYTSHISLKGNSNEVLLPFSRLEAIWMNSKP